MIRAYSQLARSRCLLFKTHRNKTDLNKLLNYGKEKYKEISNNPELKQKMNSMNQYKDDLIDKNNGKYSHIVDRSKGQFSKLKNYAENKKDEWEKVNYGENFRSKYYSKEKYKHKKNKYSESYCYSYTKIVKDKGAPIFCRLHEFLGENWKKIGSEKNKLENNLKDSLNDYKKLADKNVKFQNLKNQQKKFVKNSEENLTEIPKMLMDKVNAAQRKTIKETLKKIIIVIMILLFGKYTVRGIFDLFARFQYHNNNPSNAHKQLPVSQYINIYLLYIGTT